MKTLLFPASLVVIAGCARAPEQAPVDEADTGWDARLDSVVTWNYAPGNNGLWPDAADLDGDGKRDLVMGRDGAAAILTFKNTGAAGVYPFSPTATIVVSESSTWGGEERLALGDYNCDGEVDAAIGIRGAYTTEVNEGQIWFYAGQGGGVFTSTPTWVLQPNVANDRMGTDIAAMDLNHDGCTDLVAAGDAMMRGVLGKSTGPYLSGDTLALGANQYYGVETVGDLNGDTNQDFAWCDGYFGSGLGKVVVFLGTGTGFPLSAHRTYIGNGGEGFCGSQGSTRGVTAGDVDGDGYSDLVVGVPGATSGNGRVDVYRGSAAGLPLTPTWTVAGPTDAFLGRFGTMVLSGFDQNNDGYDDLVIGEPTRDQVGSNYHGMDWMYPGSPIGPLPGTPTWSRSGSKLSNGGAYGHSAYSVGDVNGDQFDDVLLMDEGYLDFASDLILGKADPDSDGDGVGDAIDCAPTDASVSPAMPEIYGNQKDENCNGYDECLQDLDKDGYGSTIVVKNDVGGCVSVSSEASKGGDCDDNTFATNPGTVEIIADSLDQNCDGGDLCRADADLDGHGTGLATKASVNLNCTDPGESFTTDDCNDGDMTVYTGAVEIVADGVDQNCDNKDPCFKDQDADGHGGALTTTPNDLDCIDAGESKVSDDCNDNNVNLFPGNVEVVGDGIDQDCNNGDTCYIDGDADTFGGLSKVASVDLDCIDPGESNVGTDCNDGVAGVHPGATEVLADGVDQDCDKGDTCYADGDGDTYGVLPGVASVDLDCVDAGEAVRGNDCKDANAAINPGATEIPNDGIDQNCDGVDSCLLDSDGDGYGGTTLLACASGGVDKGGDCNDASTSVKPGATELPADGVDQNCDGQESCYVDADGDGDGGSTLANAALGCAATGFSATTGDCADTNATVGPSKTDVPGDLVDRDCDGKITCFADSDSDGFAGGGTKVSADADCADPGEGTLDKDCRDNDAASYPGATEISGDGIDQDCDGKDECWLDADGDGRGVTQAPAQALECKGANESILGGDCDDDDATVSPSEVEVVGNTRDDDCDGYADCYKDDDEDGFGDVSESFGGGGPTDPIVCADEGDVSVGGDCDDGDAATRPDVTDEPPGEDRDCDGLVACWTDADGDGFGGEPVEIDVAPGATPGCDVIEGDCDDGDKAASPSATELAGNEVDEDCDGTVDCFVDGDGDGFGSTVTLPTTSCSTAGVAATSTDCDDAAAAATPGGLEVCDGIDNDCDGVADEDFEWADPSDPTTCNEDTVKFCGCESSPGAGLGWLTLAVALVARRRRG